MTKLIVIVILGLSFIFTARSYAGQSPLLPSEESKTVVVEQLNSCLILISSQSARIQELILINDKSVAIINDLKNQIIKLETESKQSSEIKTENDQLKDSLATINKQASWLLLLLALAAIFLWIFTFFRNRARYFIAAGLLGKARILGGIALLFGLLFIISVLLFLYLLVSMNL